MFPSTLGITVPSIMVGMGQKTGQASGENTVGIPQLQTSRRFWKLLLLWWSTSNPLREVGEADGRDPTAAHAAGTALRAASGGVGWWVSLSSLISHKFALTWLLEPEETSSRRWWWYGQFEPHRSQECSWGSHDWPTPAGEKKWKCQRERESKVQHRATCAWHHS